jgi:uncharacterized repeat protein (TIGR03806 family)
MDRRRPRRPAPAHAGEDAGGPYWRLLLSALLVLALVSTAAAQRIPPPHVADEIVMANRPPPLLSHFRFFRDVAMTAPNPGVTPYDLNTPLYSDGALKLRYVYIPREAGPARYSEDDVFDFPVGTALIKTFAFAADMRRPTENVRFIETRVMIRRPEGWLTLPYVWNEAQTEARLSVIGADVPVSFTNEAGEVIALDWPVPNVNQCRGCHTRAGEIVPIGPNARNLNRDYHYASGAENQLVHWTNAAIIDGLPASRGPRVPNAYNATDGALEHRARAYLDVNCAHCHNPEGPAHTSGLDLSWLQTDPARWGVNKRPVAAGRGSAGFEFAIEPGHPERSILLHRMESTDPGVMMPELGRQLVDERGLALIRQWIAEMDADGSSD